MAWDAEVVVVVIGILAPPAALFGVFLRFATHNTQTMSKIKVTTPTVTPIADHELLLLSTALNVAEKPSLPAL